MAADDDIGISTVHMLQALENRIQTLLNALDTADPAIVVDAERVRRVRAMHVDTVADISSYVKTSFEPGNVKRTWS